MDPSLIGADITGAAQSFLTGSIFSIGNILSIPIFQDHMPLALLCRVHSVWINLLLSLIQCGV